MCMEFICEICGTDNVDESKTRYESDLVCKNCGQHYGWTEAVVIELTDEQRQVLRDYRARQDAGFDYLTRPWNPRYED